MKLWLVLGSLNMAMAVALGAFGAHGLKSRLSSEMLETWQTGVTYHFYHAIGLMLLGLTMAKFGSSTVFRSAGWVMLVGIVLFSGSLYVLCLSGFRKLGMITPIGGVFFILAWVLFGMGVLRTSL